MNRYQVRKNGRNHIFTPLSPLGVHEDQIKVKKAFDIYSEKEKNKIKNNKKIKKEEKRQKKKEQ